MLQRLGLQPEMGEISNFRALKVRLLEKCDLENQNQDRDLEDQDHLLYRLPAKFFASWLVPQICSKRLR